MIGGGEVVASNQRSYVCDVPDHCDRIIWRGRYYGLTDLTIPTEGAEFEGAVDRMVQVMGLLRVAGLPAPAIRELAEGALRAALTPKGDQP